MGKISICVSIDAELWEQCKENGIKWSEAMRQGATLLLAKSTQLYRNKKQLERQLESMAKILENAIKEKEEIQQKLETLD